MERRFLKKINIDKILYGFILIRIWHIKYYYSKSCFQNGRIEKGDFDDNFSDHDFSLFYTGFITLQWLRRGSIRHMWDMSLLLSTIFFIKKWLHNYPYAFMSTYIMCKQTLSKIYDWTFTEGGNDIISVLLCVSFGEKI